MKILLVNTRHFPGGGDTTYTFNLASVLRAHGHDVTFFAMQDPRNIADPNQDLFVDHIDFRELNKRKSVRAGLQVLTRAIYSSDARARFATLLDRVKPDVVHLQNIHAQITPSVIFEASQRGLPVLWTLHDYKLICPNSHLLIDETSEICEACQSGRFYEAVRTRCKKGSLLASTAAALEAYAHRLSGVHRRVSAFLAPSAFLRDRLLANGFPADRVRHLPYVLLDDAFDPAPDDFGYLLFMGRLEFIKGVSTLTAAARLVPQVRVVLAGLTSDPGITTNLPDNVQFVGMKQGAELRELLRGARAIVVPSLCTNQPLSILEAFAAAKSVIASNLGGMAELVTHTERGLLVPPGDVEALASAMVTVTKDQAVAQRMGTCAYDYVRSTHNAKRHYSEIQRLYDDVLDKRPLSEGKAPREHRPVGVRAT